MFHIGGWRFHIGDFLGLKKGAAGEGIPPLCG
jgi:hypothetical protein